MNVDELARRALAKCKAKGWSREWKAAGCYLHLESSEFIEALRGKGETTPLEEAADVMFVLFSTLEAHGILPSDVLKHLDKVLP